MFVDNTRELAPIDAYLEQTYWQYLGQSQRVSHQLIKGALSQFYLLTYNNIKTGSYLVVASVKKGSVVTVHTFVRLGDTMKMGEIRVEKGNRV